MFDFESSWKECERYGILQIKSEFQNFLNLLIEKECKTLLEIGCWSGGTSRGFVDVVQKVISIDANTNGNIQHLQASKPGNFLFIQGWSTDPYIKARIQSICPQIDCLFIDADHSDESVRRDYSEYKDFVKPGGLIAFHDTVETKKPGEAKVSILWNELKKTHTYWEFHDADNVALNANSGIGVIQKI